MHSKTEECGVSRTTRWSEDLVKVVRTRWMDGVGPDCLANPGGGLLADMMKPDLQNLLIRHLVSQNILALEHSLTKHFVIMKRNSNISEYCLHNNVHILFTYWQSQCQVRY